jgi:hypothetical protein
MRIMVGQWETPRIIRVVAICTGWQATLQVARELRKAGRKPAFGIGPFKFDNKRGHRRAPKDWTTV